MSKEYTRTDTSRHLKFGKKKKSWRTWRKASGIHSKIRRRRAGYPLMPSIGHGTPRIHSGKVQGLKPVVVHNMAELQKATAHSIIILARVGAKKKLDLIKKAEEMHLKIANLGGKK